GAINGVEHFDLLDVYRALLLCRGALAPGLVAICGGVRNGRGMVARRGAGDGIVAAREAAHIGGRDRGRGERWFCVDCSVGQVLQSDPNFVALGDAGGGGAGVADLSDPTVRSGIGTMESVGEEGCRE